MSKALVVIHKAIQLFNDEDSWLAEELRWDHQYLIELIERVSDQAVTGGTVLSGPDREIVGRIVRELDES